MCVGNIQCLNAEIFTSMSLVYTITNQNPQSNNVYMHSDIFTFTSSYPYLQS